MIVRYLLTSENRRLSFNSSFNPQNSNFNTKVKNTEQLTY